MLDLYPALCHLEAVGLKAAYKFIQYNQTDKITSTKPHKTKKVEGIKKEEATDVKKLTEMAPSSQHVNKTSATAS